jgi:Sulfotransferase domain
MRIAVVSTPRAGNTWVRHLLGTAYQLPHLARHSMADPDWAALPPEVVLQLHWRRTPEFAAKLAEHGFRVVTVARHPLDVLVSVLHFCVHESESEHWLLGAGGSEADIYGAMPRSRAFVEYARGPRAAELLAVTPDWWGRPGVVGVRYEDLVADTEGELRRLAEALGPIRCGSLAEAIEACSLGKLRERSTNSHFWQGRPGFWRHLLPAAEAGEIAAALPDLGYPIDADPTLDALAADRNWVRLVGEETKRALRRATEGHRAQVREKDDRIAELEAHAAELEARLRASVTLSGPVARAVKQLWNRSPRIRRLFGRHETRDTRHEN